METKRYLWETGRMYTGKTACKPGKFTKPSANMLSTAHVKQHQNENSNNTLKITDFKINTEHTLTFAHAKLLEFHILELKTLNSLIQYKFLTYGHFPCYGLPHVILMPATVIHKG